MNGTKGTVFVVEDEGSLRKAIADALDLLGYETVIARNSCEALAMLAASTDESPPVAFLIDPRLDNKDLSDANRQSSSEPSGIALVRSLRRDPRFAETPILVFTGAPDLLGMAFEAGADDFLVKGSQGPPLMEVKLRIAVHTEKHRQMLQLRLLRDSVETAAAVTRDGVIVAHSPLVGRFLAPLLGRSGSDAVGLRVPPEWEPAGRINASNGVERRQLRVVRQSAGGCDIWRFREVLKDGHQPCDYGLALVQRLYLEIQEEIARATRSDRTKPRIEAVAAGWLQGRGASRGETLTLLPVWCSALHEANPGVYHSTSLPESEQNVADALRLLNNVLPSKLHKEQWAARVEVIRMRFPLLDAPGWTRWELPP